MVKSMLLKAKPLKSPLNPVFLTISALAVGCLVFSILMQYLMGLEPCRLCLTQRYIYAGLGCLGALGYLMPNKKIVRRCLFFVLGIGILVALYHSLVVFGLIESKCILQPILTQGIENFSDMIAKPQTCTEARLSFFGIPIPLLNTAIYLCCFKLLKTNSFFDKLNYKKLS